MGPAWPGHTPGPAFPRRHALSLRLSRVEYEPVKHSHVVPAGYLRGWADGRQIAMRLVGSQNSLLVGVRDAGVRSDYYRRERPGTGETIYDVEWSLAQGEDAALPLIAELPARWPLTNEDKGKVGQFMALQHLRGPAFGAWHEKHIAARAAELRADPAAHAIPQSGVTPAATVERGIEIMESDTSRATRVLSLVRSVGIAMSSMHWSLVSFSQARLATSDHPVVVWPLRRGASRPQANDLDAGVLDTLEVFFPVGPAHLLLLTWLHDEDTPRPVAGEGRHISTANAFVVANADKQWFHEPGVQPWMANGTRSPLSAELVRHYGQTAAESSPRRADARKHVMAEVAAPLSNDPVSMVTVTRRANA
jgi:Protein of unknown function (DUF4238)